MGKMESTQSQSDLSPQEAKEVIAALLFLSISKYTNPRVSKDIEHAVQSEDAAASGSRAPTQETCDSNPPIVQLVNALIDSISKYRGPFKKTVTKSDVDGQQNWLILRKLHVNEFIEPLRRRGEDPMTGVPVQTFNPAGKAYPMQLQKWNGKVFVLVGNWKKFVQENQLEFSDVLTIWAFRAVQTGGLCFVISSSSPQVPE